MPLRTAGCVLPKRGPARLYFVGLAAPRGPQLPVYSRQAALVARMLRLQERLVDAAGGDVHEPRRRRVPHRHRPLRLAAQMDLAEDVVTRLEAGERAS